MLVYNILTGKIAYETEKGDEYRPYIRLMEMQQSVVFCSYELSDKVTDLGQLSSVKGVHVTSLDVIEDCDFVFQNI